MSTPPLQLEQSLVTRLLVEAEPGFSPGGEVAPPSRFQIEVAHSSAPRERWQVRLALRISPDKQHPGPYRIELDMVGFFRLATDVDKDEAARLLGVTGASILYSAAREHLLMVTGRGPWGPMQLPTTCLEPLALRPVPQVRRAAKAVNSKKRQKESADTRHKSRR